MPEKLMQLAKSQADQVQLYWVEEDVTPVKFKDGALEKVYRKKATQISLMVIRDNKVGITYGTSFADRESLVREALNAAQYGDELDIELARQQPGTTDIYDQATADLTIEQLIAAGEKTLQRAQQHNSRDAQLNLLLCRENNQINILNSAGLNVSYRQTPYSVILGTPIPESTTDIVVEDVRCRYFDCPEEWFGDLLARRGYCDHRAKVPTGRLPVIFINDTVGALLYRLLMAVSGDNIHRGTSPLTERLDQKIFHESLTIDDDPTVPWDIFSLPCDDEGVPTRAKSIVAAGVLENFLFDLRTGKQTSNHSTGNGFKRALFYNRNITLPVTPWSTNLILRPGQSSQAEMIKSIDQGLLVDMVIGMHSGNIIQGHYSMNVGLGYVIDKGKIKGRVIDAMVSGNIYQDLQDIAALSDRLTRNFLGRAPALHCRGIDVTCE